MYFANPELLHTVSLYLHRCVITMETVSLDSASTYSVKGHYKAVWSTLVKSCSCITQYNAVQPSPMHHHIVEPSHLYCNVVAHFCNLVLHCNADVLVYYAVPSHCLQNYVLFFFLLRLRLYDSMSMTQFYYQIH